MPHRKSKFNLRNKLLTTSSSFLIAVCALSTSPVLSQTSISRLLQANATDLKLYEKADSKSNAITVEVKALTLPLGISESRNGMHLVQYNGKSYWVRSVDVVVKRSVEANCFAKGESAQQVAGTPGASVTACKK
jgi:hypothetical protein